MRLVKYFKNKIKALFKDQPDKKESFHQVDTIINSIIPKTSNNYKDSINHKCNKENYLDELWNDDLWYRGGADGLSMMLDSFLLKNISYIDYLVRKVYDDDLIDDKEINALCDTIIKFIPLKPCYDHLRSTDCTEEQLIEWYEIIYASSGPIVPMTRQKYEDWLYEQWIKDNRIDPFPYSRDPKVRAQVKERDPFPVKEYSGDMDRESLDAAIKHTESCLMGKNWDGVIDFMECIGERALIIGMMHLRQGIDIKIIREDFSLGYQHSYLLKQLSLLDQIMPNMGSKFLKPLHCCLLAKDFKTAKILANLFLDKLVEGDFDISPFDSHTKVLAAFILNDKKQFKQYLKAHHLIKKPDAFWQELVVYFDLYELVMDKDQDGFNQVFINNSKQFFTLRSGRKSVFNGAPSGYGGYGYMGDIIDFLAMGIAIVAESRGMSVPKIDSEFYPMQLL